MKYEEVTIDYIARLLKVSRKSAVQRMSRLVAKGSEIKIQFPKRGQQSKFLLKVPIESLLKTQKFAGPKMSREVDWKKFCSDPFRLTKEVTE